jgi:hypothetical protein
MSEQKLGPTDFAAEVERLKAAGTMPSLEDLLAAVADARKIYVPLILKARRQAGNSAD